jgi:hypothetical protein
MHKRKTNLLWIVDKNGGKNTKKQKDYTVGIVPKFK